MQSEAGKQTRAARDCVPQFIMTSHFLQFIVVWVNIGVGRASASELQAAVVDCEASSLQSHASDEHRIVAVCSEDNWKERKNDCTRKEKEEEKKN